MWTSFKATLRNAEIYPAFLMHKAYLHDTEVSKTQHQYRRRNDVPPWWCQKRRRKGTDGIDWLQHDEWFIENEYLNNTRMNFREWDASWKTMENGEDILNETPYSRVYVETLPAIVKRVASDKDLSMESMWCKTRDGDDINHNGREEEPGEFCSDSGIGDFNNNNGLCCFEEMQEASFTGSNLID